jgi:hypothetical protein
MNTRRTFVKKSMALVGGLSVITYAEPKVLFFKDVDWVTDKGDYYIVKVPDFKMLSREIFDKPCIILLGERAVVSDVRVQGFVNITAPRCGLVKDCHFDASSSQVLRDRPAMIVEKSQALAFECCSFITYGGVLIKVNPASC